MTSSNGKNAISRVSSLAEKSMTAHWNGNFMENTIDGVMGVKVKISNSFKFSQFVPIIEMSKS